MVFDVLRRHFAGQGLAVTYVQNVTDIDDKIIERSQLDEAPWDAVVARYYGEYEECARALGIMAPDVEPYATREIAAIIDIIRGLIERGAAYESDDGVYFDVRSFAAYGSLSRRDPEELRAGARVAVREDKRDPLDFALWKKAKPGEPTWPSPWGPGRPGWHIECSAMARRYLGDQFDIHGGATDLIFPHHENEIAQTETFTGKHPMANFWVHPGLLLVDGQKMSKSVGNFVPLTQILERYPAAAIRCLFLQTGYRKPSNFTEDAISGAIRGLRGLYAHLDALRTKNVVAGIYSGATSSPEGAAQFDAFLDDDLNTAGALGWLQKRLEATSLENAAATLALAERCLGILGLPASAGEAGLEVDVHAVKLTDDARAALVEAAGDSFGGDFALVERVIALRDEARAARDYARSDALREALARAGIAVKDTKSGTEWSTDGA